MRTFRVALRCFYGVAMAMAVAVAMALMPFGGNDARSQTPDGIENPIAEAGDPVRGRRIALDRESTCILCHQMQPDRGDGELSAGGNLAPPLIGVGARLSVAQIRLRLVDSARVNPRSIMPAYFKSEGLKQVAPNYTGRTILQAQQIEDLVAWLATLK